MGLFRQLQAARLPYITDLIPAYSSLTICYDVLMVHQPDQTAFETVAKMVEALPEATISVNEQGRHFNIPVCYEAPFAPDLAEVSHKLGIDAATLINLHKATTYRVFMLGFLPGFAYMGETDPRIAHPRHAVSKGVAGGAIGIAGTQTAIYPFDCSGGWQIIGRTPMRVFDKDSEQPVLLQPGDTVSFYSILEDEYKDYQRRSS